MDKKEFKITVENALEDEIICTLCKKLLNVAPIFCIERGSELDKICGRCVHAVDRDPDMVKSRQHAYEMFAKYVTYPCSYKKFGCDAILCWDEVAAHENVCDFQVANCPLFYKSLFPDKSCEWMGHVKKLDEHIENAHKDCMWNPPLCDWTDCKDNTIFFTRVGTHLVTVVIKYGEKSKYYCLLMINGNDIDSQCFRYQLELFDDDKNNSIILRKVRLEPLGYMRENLENKSKMLEIDLVRINEMLQHPKVISSRFGIVKKNKKEIALITGSKDHELLTSPKLSTKDELPPPDETMLQELECPVCNEHMIPPIYICETGHSICSECKKRVYNCPNCRSSLPGARNFTLEKLTTRVYYPCRNREIGCAFVTTSDKIRLHENACELSENPCILKCEWKGLRPSMYNHLTDAHQNSLLLTNTVHIRDIRDKKEMHHVLYVSGELFRFSMRVNTSGPYKYNMQHLGMIADQPKFRYEIQFVDQSPLKLNMSLTNVCQCITESPNGALTTAINIPWELIKPYIFESRYYYYKINISKI